MAGNTLAVSEQLQILSYNVFMRPLVKTNESDYKDLRLEELIKVWKERKFDIICLQELFSTGSKRMDRLLGEFSNEKGWNYIHLSSWWRKMKPIDSGLSILSRFPIIEKDAMVFTQGSDIDGYTTKGVISALIDLSSSEKKQHLLVFNTHTQANYDLQNAKYWEIQQSQFSEMALFILEKRKQHPGVPMVLCGDLNVDARNKNEWYHWMMKQLLDINNEEASHAETLKISLTKTLPEGHLLTQSTLPTPKTEFNNTKQFRITDLILEKLGSHPITFGDVIEEMMDNQEKIEKPKEVHLTHPHTLCTKERLDYILLLKDKDVTDITSLQCNDCAVEPFFRQPIDKDFPCTQLSDHYGVSAKLYFE